MTAIAVAAALAGCGGAHDSRAGTGVGQGVDVAMIAPNKIVGAVLDACHRPLIGHMRRVSAIVHTGDGGEWRLFAELPGKLRAQTTTERLLLVDGAVQHLDGRPASEAEAATARALLLLIDVAALGPLHRARRCERRGPCTFALDAGDGVGWLLELESDALVPRALTRDDERVVIAAGARTNTTWLVRTVDVPGLGRCDVQFEDSDIAWGDDFFAVGKDDAAPPQVKPPHHTRLTAPGAEPRSPTPVLVDGRALRQVLLPDPGNWPARAERYREVHGALLAQDQQIAGFGALLHDDDGAWLAVPFRSRPGKPALEPEADWRIRDYPAGRWLIVYPPAGDCASRIATGERQLQEALAAQQLKALGPILAQPFLHLEQGAPDEAQLGAATVRVAVAVE